MDLRITSISFDDFRNYERLRMAGLGDITVFVGRNAVGKTNVLEGIQLCTALSSFRKPLVNQLIREGAHRARVSLGLEDGNRLLETSLLLEDGKRSYFLNGKKKSVGDLKGLVPAVVFAPDHLDLAKKSSSVKRGALDDLGSQLSPSYHVVRRDYEKVVRYKNRLLKEEASRSLIESIDETLLTCAFQLSLYRTALFDRISAHIERIYGSISDGAERFSATYEPSWGALPEKEIASRDALRERIASCLRERSAEERVRRRSLVGPHADTISFQLDGRDAANFASQGQQRSIVLARKMAEVALVEETLGQHPVLLLDDVMSELDEHRRTALLSVVGDCVQTFVTTTTLSYFDGEFLSRARVVEIANEENLSSLQHSLPLAGD